MNNVALQAVICRVEDDRRRHLEAQLAVHHRWEGSGVLR